MASSPVPTQERQFAFGDTEWSNYMKYRPTYPPSLIKLIRSHHQEYCDKFNFAHDVASGAGVFVPVLAKELGFKHVHVSDPGPGNIQKSQELLSRWLASQKATDSAFDATLTFSRTTGEDMHMCAASHTVNLVTIMEAAHWMDGPQMMASAAETLAPGGTLALVIYCAAAHIKRNAQANTAFKHAVGSLWAHVVEKTRTTNESGLTAMVNGIRQASAGLEWVPVDHDVWTNVRRIRIRGGGKGPFPNMIPHPNNPPPASSNVRPEERYDHYEEQDEEAQGWELEVGHDWFHGYITSMEDPEHVTAMQEYADLMDVLRREFPEGKIPVEWTTDVLLVTRKSL